MNIIQRLSPEDEVTSDDIKSLQGLNLAIACNSWGDAVVAAELFGNDWESKTIPGTIHKVTGKRAGSLKFSINIPYLNDTYRGYGWEYILDYLVDDLPLRFHFILKQVADQRLAKLQDKTKEPVKEKRKEATLENRKETANEHFEKQGKSRPAHMCKGHKKNTIQNNTFTPIVVNSIESECDEEDVSENSDNDDEDAAKLLEAEIDQPLLYNIDGTGWRTDVEPDHSQHAEFDCETGPCHNLPDYAAPIEYFGLFFSLNFFALWAQYTNAYAAAIMSSLKGQCRKYSPTTAAELKAFVATIMWMAIIKSMQPKDFFDPIFTTSKVRFWFPSIFRFEQLKRFFKVSDYTEEKKNESDRMAKVRDLWESFLKRCKQFYFPAVLYPLAIFSETSEGKRSKIIEK